MQVPQQLLVQRGERGEMPRSACPYCHTGQSDLCPSKRSQDTLAGGPICCAGRRALIETSQGRLGLLQSSLHLGFQHGQQPQSQGQQPRHALDLVFLPDEQGTETQRGGL